MYNWIILHKVSYSQHSYDIYQYGALEKYLSMTIHMNRIEITEMEESTSAPWLLWDKEQITISYSLLWDGDKTQPAEL